MALTDYSVAPGLFLTDASLGSRAVGFLCSLLGIQQVLLHAEWQIG